MRRFTLIVSDVHLCGVVQEAGAWMPYRQPEHLLDEDLRALIDSAVAHAKGSPIEIVFNGDLFDFDAPEANVRYPRTQSSRDDQGAAEIVEKILSDHPRVTDAMRRAQQSGAQLVFIPGNHDAQLALPGVRERIKNSVGNASFRTLFHRTPDGIHVEHGHQYDPLCSVDSMLPNGGAIEDTIGSIASHYMPLLLGCLNPHASDPFHIRPSDLFASMQKCSNAPFQAQRNAAILAQMTREVVCMQRAGAAPNLCEFVSSETETPLTAVQRHVALFAPKASADRFVSGEMWRSYGDSTDQNMRSAMAEIAKIYPANGVVMGHTHRAYDHVRDGVFFANSGSWTPSVGLSPGASSPAGSFVWVENDGDSIRAETRYWPRST